jgi:hypothetical protein
MIGNCRGCKTYKSSLEKGKPLDCYNKEWWTPAQIRYCCSQVLWYLSNCVDFRAGEWTQCLNGSSHIDPAIRDGTIKTPSHDAEDLAAEIDARLNMLPGIERKLLEIEVSQKKTLEEFSEYSLNCLYFISRFRRRIATCSDCGGWTHSFLIE